MDLAALVEKTLKPKSDDSARGKALNPDSDLKFRPWWVKVGFSLLILLVIGLLIYVLTEPISYPEHVSVSNVSSHSITLSWTTNFPTPTKVLLVEPGIFQYLPIFFYSSNGDDRNKNNAFDYKSRTHYVSLKNLKPSTRYIAKIYSGIRQVYEQKLTTGPVIAMQSPNLVYGQVMDGDKKREEGVLVYLRLQRSESSSSALLSAMTDKEGMWSIETGNARVRNLQKSFDWKKTSYESLVVDDGKGNRFKATTGFATDKQSLTSRYSLEDKPWPTVVLKASESGELKNE